MISSYPKARHTLLTRRSRISAAPIAAQGGLAPHEGGGDVVVAVEPGHLLCQIGDALHVAPPGGDDHVAGPSGQCRSAVRMSTRARYRYMLHSGDVGAQQGVDPLRIHA